MKKSLLLGSQSAGRKFLLDNIGLVYEPLGVDVEEHQINGHVTKEEAKNLVTKNSQLKMEALLEKDVISDYKIIITADTVVWFENKIYGKALNANEARSFLENLAGNTHLCISGTTIVVKEDNENIMTKKDLYESTEVTITANKQLIDLYLNHDEWRGKAGAYAIQGLGSILIENIKGNVQNIIGLPLTKVLNYFSTQNYFSLLEFK